MPNLLIGTSYAVSAGLIIYAIQARHAPEDSEFILLISWAVIGIFLAFSAIAFGRKD